MASSIIYQEKILWVGGNLIKFTQNIRLTINEIDCRFQGYSQQVPLNNVQLDVKNQCIKYRQNDQRFITGLVVSKLFLKLASADNKSLKTHQ